jgi:acyl-CoA synthetase (AMP-forming)/AMP-acid ligase II
MAGGVPVPIYPPARLDRLEEYAQRQGGDPRRRGGARARHHRARRGVAAVLGASVPSLRDVVTVADLAGRGASWAAPEGAGADPAFIQYTSGSTGAPKGVLLTHDNLLANIRAVGEGLDVRPTDVGASWLPLYHDMGLIGTWLFCMHHGIPLALQSPLAFLARPERWLWSIHRHRATLSPAPNFAFELCVRKVPDHALEGLDLSSWRVALNGAEPVSPETIDRFVERFAPYGFRREAMMPVYGLAESAVGLCFPPVGRAPQVDRVARVAFEQDRRAAPAEASGAGVLQFVSVGAALPGTRCASSTTRAWTSRSGPWEPDLPRARPPPPATTASRGHGRDHAARRLARQRRPRLPRGGRDLHRGRRKDLIIKAGRNLVPQEIEE